MIKIIYLLVFIFVVLPLLTRLLPYSEGIDKTKSRFEEAGFLLNEITYQVENYTVHALETGDKTKPLVLFIHGSPGSSTVFLPYLLNPILQKEAHMISVDRVGYGASSKVPLPELKAQAETLLPLLGSEGEKVIIVGHSFGGAVAVQTTLEAPEKVASLILLAPTLDPRAEEKLWFKRLTQKFAQLPLVRNLVSHELLVTSYELEEMPEGIRASENIFSTLTLPVTLLHGDKDFLAPISNIAYVKAHFPNTELSIVEKEDMNHFIPWTNQELVLDAVFQSLGFFSN